MKSLATILGVLLLAGCAEQAPPPEEEPEPAYAEWTWEMRMWGAADADLARAEARYDAVSGELRVDVEVRLRASGAPEATLDLYLVEGGCPRRYGPGADEPDSWEDARSFAIMIPEGGRVEERVEATLRAPAAPGERFAVIAIADADSLFEDEECRPLQADVLRGGAGIGSGAS